MELELQTGNYCVELTPDQWDRLNALDYTNVVACALNGVGAYSVEYNGHFGRAIYFTALPNDAVSALEKIQELVGAA